MKTNARTKAPAASDDPHCYLMGGKRMVTMKESEYIRLKEKADEWEPPLPEPDADGNYPAMEYMLASLARDIIRHRRRLGLTQVELARLAGIRPETLNRVEHGTHSPSVATVEKIDRALKEASAEVGKSRNGK